MDQILRRSSVGRRGKGWNVGGCEGMGMDVLFVESGLVDV